MNPMFQWIPKLWSWAWDKRNKRLARKRKRDADRVRKPSKKEVEKARAEYAANMERKAGETRRRNADARNRWSDYWGKMADKLRSSIPPNPYGDDDAD